MKRLKEYLKEASVNLIGGAIALVVATALMFGAMNLGGPPASAQVPSLPPQPYNVELGAVITNSARAAGTVTTAKLQNLAYVGIECTFDQTAASGSPSTTFAVQFYDSASNTYQTLVTSGAITASATPTTIVVSPAIQTSSLPTGMVALQMHLPLYYRISQTITGAGTNSTGTIGCNLLK